MNIMGGSLVATIVVCAAAVTSAQQPFSTLVGKVAVRPVKSTSALEIPFITWGGDVATFHANGGLTTRSGSTYDRLGMKFKLTPGDDFVAQVKNYLSGQTPFLRGTMRMLGQASEVLGQDPRTKVRGRTWNGKRSRFILSGLMTCERCGNRYQGVTRHKGKLRSDGTRVTTPCENTAAFSAVDVLDRVGADPMRDI